MRKSRHIIISPEEMITIITYSDPWSVRATTEQWHACSLATSLYLSISYWNHTSRIKPQMLITLIILMHSRVMWQENNLVTVVRFGTLTFSLTSPWASVVRYGNAHRFSLSLPPFVPPSVPRSPASLPPQSLPGRQRERVHVGPSPRRACGRLATRTEAYQGVSTAVVC